MTPKEWTEKILKDMAENKKKRQRDINNYEAHRAGVKKAIRYKTGVYR